MREFLLILVIAIPFKSIGQADNLSLEFGTSISNFLGDLDSKLAKYRPGLALGFGSESPINTSSNLKIGILYEQKGQNFKGESTDQDGTDFYDNNSILNYVSASIQFKRYLENKKVAFSGGMYGSLLINSKINIKQTIVNGNRTTNYEVKDGDGKSIYERHDAGIVLTSSYHLNEKVYFDVKSNWGILNINANTDSILRNHNFEILLGFKLK